MSTVAAETSRTRRRDQFREAIRPAVNFLTGPGLWIAFAAFLAYSAIDPGTRKFFVTGVVVGSVYALGAIGLNLIYGVLKFGHFAHGDQMMLAAYLAFFFLSGNVLGGRTDVGASPLHLEDLPGATDTIWKFSFGYGLLLALVMTSLIMAGLLIAIDRFAYRRLRRRKSGIVIFSIASLGVALSIRSIVLMVWGPDPRSYVPGVDEALDLPFDVVLKADQIFIIVMAGVMVVATYSLLQFTKLGKAMRAFADNPDLALVSGINTDQVTAWTWTVSGVLISVAGVLLALQSQLNPALGFVVLLPLFASAILGGIGNPMGALLGAMVVGITQEVAVGIEFSIGGEQLLPLEAGYKFSVAVVILIVMLLLRPEGLLGRRSS
jgi:branched-subunit amino acid ABC-type transport system permease component